MATYEPFIQAIEARAEEPKLVEFKEPGRTPDLVPADLDFKKFVCDFYERFPNKTLPYLGGAETLVVEDAYGVFYLEDHDGYERIEHVYASTDGPIFCSEYDGGDK